MLLMWEMKNKCFRLSVITKWFWMAPVDSPVGVLGRTTVWEAKGQTCPTGDRMQGLLGGQTLRRPHVEPTVVSSESQHLKCSLSKAVFDFLLLCNIFRHWFQRYFFSPIHSPHFKVLNLEPTEMNKQKMYLKGRKKDKIPRLCTSLKK